MLICLNTISKAVNIFKIACDNKHFIVQMIIPVRIAFNFYLSHTKSRVSYKLT